MINNNLDDKTDDIRGEVIEINLKDNIINKEESDSENLKLKDLLNSNKKKNYLIEFDKNMDIQNFEEREDDLRTNDNIQFPQNTMNMTVSKRKEQFNHNNIQLNSDSNTPNNKLNYNYSEKASSSNIVKINQLSTNSKMNELDNDEYLNQYNNVKSETNTQEHNNMLYSSENESEESAYQNSNEIQSKITNMVTEANSKYNINQNYTKNIQKLKNEMNLSEGEEENISTRDKYVPEMYYVF